MLIFDITAYIITMRKRYIISNIIIIFVLISLTAVTVSFYDDRSVMATNNFAPNYKGKADDNSVALMVNVYWGDEHLESMLKTLEKYNAKITFFVGGSWAFNNPDKLAMISSKGHEIANHGYFHKDHDKISETKNREEIVMCQKVIESQLGSAPKLFAPPSGAFNKTTLKVCEELGYKVIMWSRDTIDWRDKDADITYSRATNKITAGDFVLMHPTAHTAKALPKILEYYKTQGLHAATVSSMLP